MTGAGIFSAPPSPIGRGNSSRTLGVYPQTNLQILSLDFSKDWLQFSLSQRERVGVRESAAKVRPASTAQTSDEHQRIIPQNLLCLALVTAFFIAMGQLTRAAGENVLPFRPPAVPLVTHDPYFSIWSPADKLTDADTVHWTHKPHRLTSLVRIDGKAFRVMGKEPADVPALPQTNLEVLPTRTIYTFEGEGVRFTLTFMTP